MNTEQVHIERIREEIKYRREIRNALVKLVNDYRCDPTGVFDTHTECYSEAQMIEMIRYKLNELSRPE